MELAIDEFSRISGIIAKVEKDNPENGWLKVLRSNSEVLENIMGCIQEHASNVAKTIQESEAETEIVQGDRALSSPDTVHEEVEEVIVYASCGVCGARTPVPSDAVVEIKETKETDLECPSCGAKITVDRIFVITDSGAEPLMGE